MKKKSKPKLSREISLKTKAMSHITLTPTKALEVSERNHRLKKNDLKALYAHFSVIDGKQESLRYLEPMLIGKTLVEVSKELNPEFQSEELQHLIIALYPDKYEGD